MTDEPEIEPTIAAACIRTIADFAWHEVKRLTPEQRVEMLETLNGLDAGNCPFSEYHIRDGLVKVVKSAIRGDAVMQLKSQR